MTQTSVTKAFRGYGASLVARLARRVGDRYELGCFVAKSALYWTGPWDCAELVTWGVRQEYGTVSLYGVQPPAEDAYTGYWAADCDAGRVIRIDPSEALRTPGALLLRRPAAQGASGHIAVSDGYGGTVEAYSTSMGVIRGVSTGRRWDDGILIPGVEYRILPIVVPTLATVYRPGSTGPAVAALQRKIAWLGFDPGPADGVYGPRTVAAVVAYQRSRGLLSDGEVGPRTIEELSKA